MSSPDQERMLALLGEIADTLGRSKGFDAALRDALWLLVRRTGVDQATLFAAAGTDCQYVVASSDDDALVGVPVQEPESTAVAITLAAGVERQLSGPDVIWHIPLQCRGEVFGVLEARATKRPLGDDLALVRIVAGFLSPTLYGSDLYRALEERSSSHRRPSSEVLLSQRALDKYREFFCRAADGVAVLDDQGRILLINPAAQQITGYANEGVVGRHLTEIISADDRDAFDALVTAALAGSLRSSFEVRMVTTSNDTIVASMSTSVLSEHDDVVVLSFRDITERRYLSDELRRTKRFLERLIDSAYDAVVASDVAGWVVLFNKVAERVFARKAADVVGKMTLEQLYPAEVLARLRIHLARGGDENPTRPEVLRDEIVDAHGSRIPVQISGSVLYENGVEVGMVANICDLRERLRMERQLIQTEERLVRSERQALLAELAGTTAHELNQPLTSIMGYAELLQRRVNEADPNRRAAEVIYQESQRMADIVRQIGQITHYQTKAYVGNTQILDLARSSDGSSSAEDDTDEGGANK